MVATLRTILVFSLLLLLIPACDRGIFQFGDGNGNGDGDAGGSGADAASRIDGGSTIDATPQPDACSARPEMCNLADEDCDGNIDEGFNLDADPANCGSCGNQCNLFHAAGVCNTGSCEFSCLPGFVDLNGDLEDPGSNGCEYQCIETNGGVEECDFSDNDCDGNIDEDFNLDSDLNNCGGCGQICIVLNADAECAGGVCGFSECDSGFEDVLDGVPGCEYACPQFPPAAGETCDNIDNNCDGVIDEQPIAGEGAPCSPFPEGDEGECEFGQQLCQFGTVTCQNAVGPSFEICDDRDNDCDGTVDNGFDKQNDPKNCGGCGIVCDLPDAIAGCDTGSCVIAQCKQGFVDANGDLSDGCEYACTPTGPEVCDGIDNDCDTLTDDADPDFITVANFCRTAGECSGTVPTCSASSCSSTVTWRCIYTDPDAEVDACGDLLLQETACDDLDGDCDNGTDESFLLKGAICDEDGTFGTTFKQGICRGDGTLACNGAQDGLVCSIENPGQPAEPSESCDGEDDDCDGLLDEAAPNDVVAVSNGVLAFNMFRFEASRPDASLSSPGSLAHRACSRADVLPWVTVSQVEAELACIAAGARLCSEAEWQLACEGLADNRFPYGDVYEAFTCNGFDYDIDCTPPNEDMSLPTGSPYGCPPNAVSACESEFGVLDMSGNVKEWTGTELGGPGSGTYRVRGGSFDNIEQGLTCDFDFIAFADDIRFPNLGFRCCTD